MQKQCGIAYRRILECPFAAFYYRHKTICVFHPRNFALLDLHLSPQKFSEQLLSFTNFNICFRQHQLKLYNTPVKVAFFCNTSATIGMILTATEINEKSHHVHVCNMRQTCIFFVELFEAENGAFARTFS